MQESLRVRKETLRAGHEDIKKLREDLLREGESVDTISTEEARNLEQQELNRWRGAAAKRQRILPAAERISKQVQSEEEETPRGDRYESTMKDVRMSDEGLDGLDGSLSS